MDLSAINQELLLAAAAAAGLVLGLCLPRMSGGKGPVSLKEDRRDSHIRQIEADLRVTQAKLKEATDKLESSQEEYDEYANTVYDLEAVLAERDQEVEELRQEVKKSIGKTKELRVELQERATETIREHARANEIETELEVVKAGSDLLDSELTKMREEEDDES